METVLENQDKNEMKTGRLEAYQSLTPSDSSGLPVGPLVPLSTRKVHVPHPNLDSPQLPAATQLTRAQLPPGPYQIAGFPSPKIYPHNPCEIHLVSLATQHPKLLQTGTSTEQGPACPDSGLSAWLLGPCLFSQRVHGLVSALSAGGNAFKKLEVINVVSFVVCHRKGRERGFIFLTCLA